MKDVYGFNMSPISDEVHKAEVHEANVHTVKALDIITEQVKIKVCKNWCHKCFHKEINNVIII